MIVGIPKEIMSGEARVAATLKREEIYSGRNDCSR